MEDEVQRMGDFCQKFEVTGVITPCLLVLGFRFPSVLVAWALGADSLQPENSGLPLLPHPPLPLL